MRLTTRKKRGIFGFLFNRITFSAILLSMQLVLYLSFFHWFDEVLPNYELIQIIFTVGMTIYLFNKQMDSSAKLTWLVLIAIFPVSGAALLLYNEVNPGRRRLKKRSEAMISQTMTLLPKQRKVLKTLEESGSGLDDLNRFIRRTGCFPVYSGTEVQYYALGDLCLPAMLEELERAKRFIYLEFFIIAEGEMWGAILEVLARKAKEGVDVRVLYDGTCEVKRLPHDYPARLAALGIHAKVFSPITAAFSTQFNYRDHRKILVIDGQVAFNGGINLADEYVNRISPFGHWKDTAVRLRGSAVQSFTLMFLQMWNMTEHEPDFSPCLAPAAPQENAEGFVMPFGESPLDEDKVGESIYIDTLARANDYVYFMTPYLILDGELETALRFAAQRGVDVRIILPGIPDKFFAYALAKSHYLSLMDAGVRLYEYAPGFVHAKVCLSDGCRAVVGTINLDYRSLYHHFECATYLYRTPCIAAIEADFTETFFQCREVTRESFKHGNLLYRIVGGCLKVIAPLM